MMAKPMSVTGGCMNDCNGFFCKTMGLTLRQDASNLERNQVLAPVPQKGLHKLAQAHPLICRLVDAFPV